MGKDMISRYFFNKKSQFKLFLSTLAILVINASIINISEARIYTSSINNNSNASVTMYNGKITSYLENDAEQNCDDNFSEKYMNCSSQQSDIDIKVEVDGLKYLKLRGHREHFYRH